MLRSVTLAATILATILVARASANPIVLPSGAYIDEDLHITIEPNDAGLKATVVSEFLLYPRDYNVEGILFPVPQGSHNIAVFQVVDTVETPIPWQCYTSIYPTILPEEPNLPVIEWYGPWPSFAVLKFKVTYQHDLIDRPDEKVFFYASGVSKLLGTTQFFNVDFDVTLPPCYSASALCMDTTPWPWTQSAYTMNFIIHPSDSGFGSMGFRIYKDIILSLKPDVAACDCSGNGTPDYEELSYPVTFGTPRNAAPQGRPEITPADYEGDFDGDGDTDKVVAHLTNGTVTVMLNDGAGNYSAAQSFGALNPGHVKVFDLDGDGDSDFVVACDSLDGLGIRYPTAVTYINDGSGRFRPGQALRVTSVSWTTPLQVKCSRTTLTVIKLWWSYYATVSAAEFVQIAQPAPTATDFNFNHIPDYCESLIPGDLDFNGFADANDAGAFSQQWLRTDCRLPVWCFGADYDRNTQVHFVDYALFAAAWASQQ